MTEALDPEFARRGHNAREWSLLANALELETGFALFIVLVADSEVEGRLGALLDARASALGRRSVVVDASSQGSLAPIQVLRRLEPTAQVLARIETTTASRRSVEALERCFAQLNQSRDSLVRRVPGPLLILLRPDALRHLQDVAPDLYSVHRDQLDFLGFAGPAVTPHWLLPSYELSRLLALEDLPLVEALADIDRPEPAGTRAAKIRAAADALRRAALPDDDRALLCYALKQGPAPTPADDRRRLILALLAVIHGDFDLSRAMLLTAGGALDAPLVELDAITRAWLGLVDGDHDAVTRACAKLEGLKLLSIRHEQLRLRGDLEACLGARGETQRDTSLGLFAEGFVAKTGSTPGTAASWLRALDENPGARGRAGFHHGLLDPGRSVAEALARRLGPTHPATAAFAVIRAKIFMDTGRGAEAEEAAEQIWRGFERSSDAPEALLHALALLFEQFERPARARAVLGRAKSSLASLPPWVLELERRLPVKAPKVYLIYRSKDGPAAGELARALRVEWGIDVWFDQWEIRAGDNVIAMMEEGLAAADGGLVFVSREGLEAGWAAEEYAAILTRVIDGKGFIMPVLADFSATEALPPFLAARRRVDHRDVETIAREIYAQVGRESGSKPALGAAPARFELHCRLDLRGEGDELLVHYDGHEVRIPAQSLSDAFTGPLGEALAAKLHNHPGDAVLSICADDFGLLALPWEAARLPHGARYRPLALIPRLTVARTLECSSRVAALPGIDGPLRVLFVVASPRDDHDWEREQERILDGLERARLARPRVVFVEALPTLEGVRWQLDAEPFHVVHFVAHGGPGELLLEDERGQPEVVDGPRLAASLTDAAHPPLAVVFSVSASADGGDQSAMAGELLRAGVPRVIAMRGSVSEGYASELAGYFYAALAARPSVARALAESRRQLEAARAQRAQTSSTAASEPEYAKVMAFSRAEDLDAPLYDVTRPWDPPPEPRSLVPVRGMVSRPVGWVVGRRAEGQTLFAALTDPGHAGALVWGVGGSGKSTLATSLAQRLVRMGWAVVAVVGRFTVADLVRHARRQLTGQLVDSAAIRELVAIDDRQRAEESLDEQELLAPLARLLYAERVLLLLDNFEDNLPGDALPADLSGAGERPYRATPSRESLALFETLLPAARGAGAVLITCRFDLQEADELSRLGLGPVSPAAMRRLQWRLPGLMNLSPRERERTLALLGGHPRALEFADALLRTTSGRPEAAFVDILRRLEALARGSNEQLPDVVDASPRERVEQASRLVAEDVLLEALLATLDEESRRLLDAAAVYRRAVPLGAMKAVADAVGLDWDERRLREGIEVLVSRTLLAVAGPGARGSGQSWVVHRWIAARLQHEDERSKSAHLAAAKWWGDTFRNVDAILERIEHLIAARRLELADELAERLRFSTSRRGLSRFAYSLSERMLEVFTEPDRRRARWLANLAEHTEALVGNDEALALYLDSFQLFEDALARDPENKERLHDVLVGSGRLADLYRSMGKNEDARSCYERARSCYDRALSYYERGFEIAESLVRVASSIEQDDAKLNLVKIQSSLGMQLLQFGASDRAEQHLQASLDLANALARAHPDEVEFQLTLAQTYGRFGDLSLELNRHQQALESYQSCREILEPLASRSPMRLDIRDGLAAAYENLGLCQKDITLIDKAIEIYREWFEREPDRKKLLDQLARASLLKAEMAKRLCDEQSLVNARRDALPLLHHFRELDQRGGLAEDSRVYYEALEGEFGEAPS